MPNVLVVYESRSGNTENMAMVVVDGARAAKVDVEAKKAVEVALQDLEGADDTIECQLDVSLQLSYIVRRNVALRHL